MSQVMPDTGVVSTDGDALPELYHQAVKTMLAHRGNQILMRDVRVMFIAPPVSVTSRLSRSTIGVDQTESRCRHDAEPPGPKVTPCEPQLRVKAKKCIMVSLNSPVTCPAS